MKPQNAFLTLLILLISFQFCFGQEKPQAELIDEFGSITCEDLIARQDNLIYLLQNEPASIGYIVIYSKKGDLRTGWRNKRFVDGQTESRGFDERRIIVVRGKEGEELRIQFWKVPAGAAKPDFNEIEWDYDLSNSTKPFVYYSSENDGGACSIGLQLKTYSNYLIANSDARGNIVILTKSKNEFQKEKLNLLNKLTNYKVLPAQLRFFFVQTKRDYLNHELWIVPRKKK